MQHSLTAMLFAVVAPHLSAAYSIHGQLTDEVQNGVSIARTSATDYDEQGNALVSSYTANALNQYTQRTVPGYAAIRGENRLVMASNDTVVVTYAYDHRGRMVRKEISHESTETRRIEYLWDDWNIIREIQWPVASDQRSVGTLATSHYPLVTDYVWGLDIDGTLQGAGGVGGLLAVVRDDGVFFPTYDANGNISEYVSTNGEIVAHYDYSPFGEPLVTSGPLAATFTHQFSTKPYCVVTGFSEYQMRKYRPEIGRWMSRDPIGERGGINQLSFANNNSGASFDRLGLLAQSNGCKCYEHSFVDRPCKEEYSPCGEGGECVSVDSGEPQNFHMPWRMCMCMVRKTIIVIRKKYIFCGEERECHDIIVTLIHPSGKKESYVIKQKWQECSKR